MDVASLVLLVGTEGCEITLGRRERAELLAEVLQRSSQLIIFCFSRKLSSCSEFDRFDSSIIVKSKLIEACTIYRKNKFCFCETTPPLQPSKFQIVSPANPVFPVNLVPALIPLHIPDLIQSLQKRNQPPRTIKIIPQPHPRQLRLRKLQRRLQIPEQVLPLMLPLLPQSRRINLLEYLFERPYFGEIVTFAVEKTSAIKKYSSAFISPGVPLLRRSHNPNSTTFGKISLKSE